MERRWKAGHVFHKWCSFVRKAAQSLSSITKRGQWALHSWGKKSKTYISYIYGQQTSSHCWLPPILSHAQDSLSVCIVAPHLRLFHVQLSKLLVGALQDFAERTLTDPGARGPTDTWAVSLRAIWVQMVNMYIRIYIYIILYICVCVRIMESSCNAHVLGNSNSSQLSGSAVYSSYFLITWSLCFLRCGARGKSHNRPQQATPRPDALIQQTAGF